MTDINSLRLETNHLDFFGVTTMLPSRPVDEGGITRDRVVIRQAAGPRRSARLRARGSSEPPVSHALQPWPVQASPTRPAPISQLGGTKRKRSQEDFEAEADQSKGE